MKNSDKFMEQYFGNQLQNQLDEDYIELMKVEQEEKTFMGRRKIDLPQGDIFEYKRLQQIQRRQQREAMERDSNPRNRRDM